MFRAWAAGLNLYFIAIFYSPSTPVLFSFKSHQYTLREMLLQQAASEDSGHWDYALLLFYDEFARSVIFSGFTSVTDFGWSERAAVLSADFLNSPEPQTLLDVCQSVQHFFTSFGKNVLLLSLIFLAITTASSG